VGENEERVWWYKKSYDSESEERGKYIKRNDSDSSIIKRINFIMP